MRSLHAAAYKRQTGAGMRVVSAIILCVLFVVAFHFDWMFWMDFRARPSVAFADHLPAPAVAPMENVRGGRFAQSCFSDPLVGVWFCPAGEDGVELPDLALWICARHACGPLGGLLSGIFFAGCVERIRGECRFVPGDVLRAAGGGDFQPAGPVDSILQPQGPAGWKKWRHVAQMFGPRGFDPDGE